MQKSHLGAELWNVLVCQAYFYRLKLCSSFKGQVLPLLLILSSSLAPPFTNWQEEILPPLRFSIPTSLFQHLAEPQFLNSASWVLGLTFLNHEAAVECFTSRCEILTAGMHKKFPEFEASGYILSSVRYLKDTLYTAHLKKNTMQIQCKNLKEPWSPSATAQMRTSRGLERLLNQLCEAN